MICYVILHYLALEETINCVSTIKKTINSDKKIIIVDNCSPNGTGKQLVDFYLNDSDVEVIVNQENLGFAKGNNIGYKIAKEKYNSDFIVIMNNDIELVQEDFESRLFQLFYQTHFYILGPDIYSTTYMIHQNPKRLQHYTKNEICDLLQRVKNRKQSGMCFKIKCAIKKNFILNKKVIQLKRKKQKINYAHVCSDIILHGSCIIFSKLFIDKMEFAFYPKTFFYYETEILDYLCTRDNMKVIYSPDLKVLHHQNVSTNLRYKKVEDKTKFAYRCNLQSLSAFYDLVCKDGIL